MLDFDTEEFLDPTDYADFDEDLITEEERQKLYEPDYVEEPIMADMPPLGNPKAARGKFYRDRYVAPFMNRDIYIKEVNEESRFYKYSNCLPIEIEDVIHLDRTYSTNFYIADMQDAVSIFKTYYGAGKLYVINGFRSPHDIGLGAHSTGLALDIKADDMIQGKRIMNAAFMAGFPTIIPNGDFAAGDGYVHIDLAPKAEYNYGSGSYSGPWS